MNCMRVVQNQHTVATASRMYVLEGYTRFSTIHHPSGLFCFPQSQCVHNAVILHVFDIGSIVCAVFSLRLSTTADPFAYYLRLYISSWKKCEGQLTAYMSYSRSESAMLGAVVRVLESRIELACQCWGAFSLKYVNVPLRMHYTTFAKYKQHDLIPEGHPSS
jgi:hypothetical protein